MQFLSMVTLLGAVAQGLLWSILAIGVYITYRVLDYSDLTTEGSFPLGAAVATNYIVAGWSPLLATLMACVSGIAAGFVTGILHTKLKIPPLLSGILSMTGLYSINLRIMGKANVSIPKGDTIIAFFTANGMSSSNAEMAVGLVFAICIIMILWILFKTEIGFAIRATGDNPDMIRALGVNTNLMIMIGLMLGNAIIALSGGIMAQYNRYADIGMGTGTIVIGLASVIIGEVIFGDKSIIRSLISVVLGSILYRVIIALVLENGLEPTDLKLLSSILLAVCLSLPVVKEKIRYIISYRQKAEDDIIDKIEEKKAKSKSARDGE